MFIFLSRIFLKHINIKHALQLEKHSLHFWIPHNFLEKYFYINSAMTLTLFPQFSEYTSLDFIWAKYFFGIRSVAKGIGNDYTFSCQGNKNKTQVREERGWNADRFQSYENTLNWYIHWCSNIWLKWVLEIYGYPQCIMLSTCKLNVLGIKANCFC